VKEKPCGGELAVAMTTDAATNRRWRQPRTQIVNTRRCDAKTRRHDENPPRHANLDGDDNDTLEDDDDTLEDYGEP